ncbi:uncharacterized protein RSE6_10527 [Rhynchosporium secalis]|uniref:Heterokaryon incompatibility domain-containing protein n=1 Tax=Rhynchosporium secalis TaxID=38038 RepID=A0A1E1MKN6_RHYSE|nr:uncharacterized protein RSE6_10527 [Rhynchosporium secalis]
MALFAATACASRIQSVSLHLSQDFKGSEIRCTLPEIQLCSNEGPTYEALSSHVAIMSSVYKEARMAVAWLGEEPEGVEIARMFRPIIWGKKTALEAISHNPYWSRVWLVQGLLSTPLVILLRGSGHFFEDQMDLWEALSLRLLEASSGIIMNNHGRLPDRGVYCANPTRLSRTCESKCGDRRDRIYGLLSLATYIAEIARPRALEERCTAVP